MDEETEVISHQVTNGLKVVNSKNNKAPEEQQTADINFAE